MQIICTIYVYDNKDIYIYILLLFFLLLFTIIKW